MSIIFKKLNNKTKEVLDAANTKWNFHRYDPGLVGGHCIGVDPYYLTYKSEKLGYQPNVVLAGRQINNSMVENGGKCVQKVEKGGECFRMFFKLLIDIKYFQGAKEFKFSNPDLVK